MAAVALICMTSSYAQETRNARVIVGINNLSYTVKEKPSKTAEVLGTIADALLTGEVTTQLDGYQEAVRAAIVKGFSQARRITAIDGQLTENELAAKNVYYIDATVSAIVIRCHRAKVFGLQCRVGEVLGIVVDGQHNLVCHQIVLH